jgi:outer membrane protein TolC
MISGWDRSCSIKARRDQAIIERKSLETRLEELKRQISLQVREAYDDMTVASLSIETSKDQAQSARQSFKIIRRKYEEGMAAHVEYLDARTNLTRSEINYILTRYNYLVKLAEFERVTAAVDHERY